MILDTWGKSIFRENSVKLLGQTYFASVLTLHYYIMLRFAQHNLVRCLLAMCCW